MKTLKKCSLVAVFCKDKVLLTKNQHQGYEVLDLLGAVISEDENSIAAAKRALSGYVAGEHQLTPHGTFTSFITKPEGIVELVADAYIVTIDDSSQIKADTARPTVWMTREELYHDPRNIRNSRLFDKFFDKKPINLTLHEDQMGLWIDAKITQWDEPVASEAY